MQDSFDPYLEWLGVAGESDRPNHYQLLGLEPFESDAAKIAAAAERQMSRAFKVQASPRLALWQRILSELATAKHVLSDEFEKSRYDEQLRRGLAIALRQTAATHGTLIPNTALRVDQSRSQSINSQNSNSHRKADRQHDVSPMASNPMPPALSGPTTDLPSLAAVAAAVQQPRVATEAAPNCSPSMPAHLLPTHLLPAHLMPQPLATPTMVVQSPLPPGPPTVAPPLAPPPPPAVQPTHDEPQNPFAPRATALDFSYTDLSASRYSSMPAYPADDEVLPPQAGQALAHTYAGPTIAAAVYSVPTLAAPVYTASPIGSMPAHLADQSHPTDEVHPVGVAHRSVQSRPQQSNQTVIAAAALLVLASVVGLAVAFAGGYISIGPPVAKHDPGHSNNVEPTEGTAKSQSNTNGKQPDTPLATRTTDPARGSTVSTTTRPNEVTTPVNLTENGPQSTEPNLKPAVVDQPSESLAMVKPAPKSKSEAEPTPSKPAVDPQQSAKFRAQIIATREALGARNFPEAKRLIDQLNSMATGDDQQSIGADVEQLQRYTVGFWDAVKQSVKGLQQGDQLQIGSTFVIVVESGDDQLSIKTGGQIRRFNLLEIPAGLAMALAKKWYNDKPDNKVFMGAFLFVDPRSEVEDAKKLWEDAGKAGVPTKGLLALLPYAKSASGGGGGLVGGSETVPDVAAIASAVAALKTRFAPEYAAAVNNPKKLELSKKLLDEAAKPDIEPAVRYAMLREARDLAIDSAQAAPALSAVEMICKHFAVDPLDAKTELLGKLLPTNAMVARAVATAGIEVVDQAIAADRKDLALKVVELAQAAALKSQNAPLMKQVKDRRDKLAAK